MPFWSKMRADVRTRLSVHAILSIFLLIIASLVLAKSATAQSRNGELYLLWKGGVVSKIGMHLHLAEPAKHPANPIITPQYPWEGDAVYLFGTVRYDSERQIFEMWYQTYDYGARPNEETYVCYATSEDGIQWHKPNLGITEYHGSRANNIVLTSHGWGAIYSPSVFYDSNAPRERRYKMIYSDWSTDRQGSPINVAFSPDGIHWMKYRLNPVARVSSDALSIFAKKVDGGFLLFSKTGKSAGRNRRRGLARSGDFVTWNLVQDDIFPSGVMGEDNGPYWMTASSLGGRAVGMLGIYETDTGRIYPTLTYSNNMEQWYLPEPADPAIPLGAPGEFDDGMIFTQSNVFMSVGDEVWTYYGGWNAEHDKKPRSAAIGLAVWSKERFLGFQSGPEGGVLQTHSFRLEREYLSVTADVAPGGLLVAGLYYPDGSPVPGFSEQDADQIRRSGRNITLSWHGKADLSALKGERIFVRFFSRDATIYGYINTSESGNLRSASKTNPGQLYENHLQAIYPNPTRKLLTIHYQVADAGRVELAVWDTLGRKIETIYESYQHAGMHKIGHSVGGYSPGVYLITFSTKNYQNAKKVVVIE